MKLLIVGFKQTGHMGGYLAAAARRLGIDCDIADSATAYSSSSIARSFYWHFRGKRPARLRSFGIKVVDTCIATARDVVLTTGSAPLDRPQIERLRQLGIKVINYSTDDPWNPAHQADWFLSALSAYDAVFTPRRANLDDFLRCGVRTIYYLPFAYDPGVHRPWPDDAPPDASSDVLFVGGCDGDRFPLISSLIDEGLHVALFGGYWDRYSKTRPYWRGIADQDVIRSASAAARVCLCLVRRANRDGNTMRSFEAAAIGGCLLVEDTADHRELFGPDDHAVRYFKTNVEMLQEAKLLLADEGARRRLSVGLRERFSAGRHTYADRLSSMLQLTMQDEIVSAQPERIRVGGNTSLPNLT
jgi:spore maturation protein CgeB